MALRLRSDFNVFNTTSTAAAGSGGADPRRSTSQFKSLVLVLGVRLSPCVAAGFDLMDYFSVRNILGTRYDEGQSSYVRLGTMPIVQQTG